jgi:hypothetical protein
MYKTLLSCFLLLFINLVNSDAQKNEFGLFAGIDFYWGEVNPTKVIASPLPAYGIVYRHNIKERFALRLNAIFGNLAGSDAKSSSIYQQLRNQSFNSNITDFSLQTEFHFFPYDKKSRYNYYTPYLIAGIGMVLAPDPNSSFQVIFPFGGGFKIALTRHLSFGGEWTIRKTFSDYLDQLPNDVNNLQLTNFRNKQRSNSQNKDWYNFLGLVVTYGLGSKNYDCPAYR